MSLFARLLCSSTSLCGVMPAPPNASRSPRGFASALLIACLLILAGPATAADWYASPLGTGTKDCMSAANACVGIQAAIDKAAANDTVHVGAGNYAFTSNRIRIEKEGLRLVGDNSPFAKAYATPPGPGEVAHGTFDNKAANAAVLKAASSSAATVNSINVSGMIWVSNVKNVHIENLYIEVNACGPFVCSLGAPIAKEAIVATGAVNGLELINNYIKITNGSSAIAIGVNVQSGGDSSVPASETRSSDQFVTIEGNVVEPTTSASAAAKRAIALQNNGGVIRGNQVAATTQDMWIPSPSTDAANPANQRRFIVENNWFFGRLGLYVAGGNNFLEPTQIRGNHFVMSTVSGDDTDAHSLRLMSPSAPGTVVEDNVFTGFRGAYRAIWIQSRSNVTIQDNTFTPLANQTDFNAVLLGNFVVQSGAPSTPQAYGATLLRNTFNTNGAPANTKGKAILLIDDNDPSSTAPAAVVQIGDGSVANANTFDSGMGWYVALDDRSCLSRNHITASGCNGNSSYAIGQGINYTAGTNGSSATQKRPFKWDVSATGNTFGGVFMGNMDQAQYDAVWAKTFDNHNKVQGAATVGNVLYGWTPPAAAPQVDLTITVDPANDLKVGANAQMFSLAAHNNGGAGVVRGRITAVRDDGASIPMQHGGSDASTDALAIATMFGPAALTAGSGNSVFLIYPNVDVALAEDDDLPAQDVSVWFRVPGKYNVTAEIIDAADSSKIYGTNAFSITVSQNLSVSFTGTNPVLYNTNPQPLAFTVSPASNPAVADLGAKVSLLYANDSQAPTNAGTYAVNAISVDGDYLIEPAAATSYVINKAAGSVAFESLAFNYSGQTHPVIAKLLPVNASCAVSPANVGPAIGSYDVTATCTDANYDAAPLMAQAVVGGANSVHVFQTGKNYASVADALADSLTENGMTVQLAPGTYSGSIALTKGVKLVGGVAFIDGAAPMLMAGPTLPINTVIDGGNAALDGITVANGVTGATISGFEIRNFTRDCVSAQQGNNGLLVEESVIHHCGQHGIYVNGIADIQSVTIRNNEVHDVGGRGIVVWNGVKRDITITDNWVHDLSGCCGIELQDGSAAGALVTGNLVENTGDSGMGFIQLTSGSIAGRANVISGNTIKNSGRFGIEIKIPNGTGLDSGDGAILVENNTVSGPTDYTLGDVRDRAGISVIRRSLNSATYPFQVDSTLGVIVRLNQVSGFKTLTPSTSYRGYGLVIEGMGSSVYDNILSGNDVAVQIQQANPNGLPPGDSNQTPASAWFGRGNAPLSCVGLGANVATGNTLGDAAKFQPTSASMLGGIKNETTGTWYCSINAAITAATAGDTLSIIAGTYAQNVIVNKAVKLKGPKAGVHGNDPTRAAGDGEAVIKPATDIGILISANDVTVDGLTVQSNGNSGLQSGAHNGVKVLNTRFVNSATRGIYVEGLPASTDWLIEGNLFDTLTGAGSTAITLVNSKDLKVLNNVIRNVTYQGVQLSYAETAEIRGNNISETDFDGINVANGAGVVIAGNTIASVNRLSGADRGAMRLYAGMTAVSIMCNNVDATKGGIVLRSGTTSGLNVFHNALVGGTSVVSYWTTGADIGSNWYGGNAGTVGGPNANGVNVADALSANPFGDTRCGTNTPVSIVAYAGTDNQSTAVDTAFNPLRTRVQDVLGGAVAGQSITLAANTVAGATAVLGTTSGNSNYNGELVSTATANSVVGPYTVDAASGSLATAFSLNNAIGAATITLDAASLNATFDNSAHAVTATTIPGALTYSVTYDGAPTAPTNAGTYTVVATVTDPNYIGSVSGTLTITQANGTVEWLTTSFVYDSGTHVPTARIAEEPASACVVSGTVGPGVGTYPVTASCTGANYSASGMANAFVTKATAPVALSHLTQAQDGSPKSVVVTTTPAGLPFTVTYAGSTTPPSAVGSYAVIATITDANYSGSASGTLNVVAGASDIALVLNGPVDPVHVGETAQYAATMLANPALHSGETFGYKITLNKSGGSHVLELADLASMEVFYQGDWVDATTAFGSIPFQVVGGQLIYIFPDGLPGFDDGFPIQDASWTWNFRFSFADTGTYVTTAELVDGISHAPIDPAVTASIATVVEASLPPTDMHLILGGPAGNVTLGSFAEYNGTLLADPLLHDGETFFVKVTVAKSGGTMTAADFTAMQIFLGGQWVDGDDLGVTFTDDGHGNLVYLFPESQLPGGFPIEDAQWSWNFRFNYANTGVYSATAQVIPAYQAGFANPDVFASAAIATTVVDAPMVTPEMKLLLIGPVDDVEVNSPAEYTGTMLANPADFTGRQFWVRVRLSKNGGADPMTATDLAKMELYNGGWQDATAALQAELQIDNNDLVYLFPQPSSAFPIIDSIWTWHFRFTYASEGVYSASADVIDAADLNPLTAVSLANGSVETNVVPESADISLQLNGPVAGIEVGQPAQYVGTLRADPLPDPSRLFFVEVRLHKSTGPMQVSDLSKMELLNGGVWQDATTILQPELIPDSGDLVYLFPKPTANSGFPIDSPEWSWQFRFTYADAATYTATARVVDAADLSQVSLPVTISTEVSPASPNVSLQLNGPVAGVETDVPAAYIGRLINAGPALTENVFVKVRVELDGGTLAAGDVSAEVWDGSTWQPGSFTAVAGGLEVDFPDSAGFALPSPFDFTHQFRINYHVPGLFSASAKVIGVNSSTVYAQSGMFTQVVPQSAITASVLIDPASLRVVYDGLPHAATVTTTPAVQGVNITYNGSTTAPTDAGTYVVIATVVDPLYVGSASAILVIDKAPSIVTIDPSDLHQSAGMTFPVGAIANPVTAGSSIMVTYNGSATVPTAVGSYTVVATLVDPNYIGSASAILVVGDGAQVSISIDDAPAMALIGANAPYTDLVPYLGSIGNAGVQTSQAIHFELQVVRIDDGNGSGGQPIAIATDDVLACVYDPSGWAAQDPDYHNGCPQDYNSLFLSQSAGSLNGRPSTTFRYPNLAQNDQPLPTISPVSPMPPVLFAFKRGQYQVRASVVGTNGMVYATAIAGTTVPDVAIGYNGPSSGPVEEALLSQSTLTNFGGRVDGNVIVRVTLSDTGSALLSAADATLYYQVGSNFLALPWTQAGNNLVTYYGPGTGFPLEDGHNATTSAQGIFHREGSYNVLYEVVDIATQMVLYASSQQPVTIGVNLINFDVAGLNPVYTGAPLPVTVAPANVPHTVMYEPMVGASCPSTPTGNNTTAPTNAGSYCVYVAASAPYSGSWSGTLVIAKATATISIDDSLANEVDRTFNGLPQAVSATTDPAGLDYLVTYNGDSTAPSAAGSYALLASIDDPNYSGIVTGTLVISAQGGATIVLDDLDLVDNKIHRTFSGSPVAPATATTTPANVSYAVTYIGDGSTVYPLTATPPTAVGQYHVVATTIDANYGQVSAAGTLVIEAQAANIALDAATLTAVYDGTAHAVTATTTPAGIAYSVTYDGLLDAPVAAGSYAVVASITDGNYAATPASGTLVISAKPASIALDVGTLNAVYDGSAHAVTATTTPAGLVYTVTYDGLLDAPTAVGSYAVVATINDPNHMGSPVNGTLVISAINAVITLDAATLNAVYDGNGHAVTATTTPAGLAYTLTYAGGSTPINAGSYAVQATITAPGHTGSASGTLVIEKASGEVLFGQTSFQFDGSSHASSARIAQEPANAGACSLSYAPAMPTEVSDSSTATATCDGVNYSATASTALQITAKPVLLALAGTGSFPYTGTAYVATATVSGEVAGFTASVGITYNPGGSNAPVAVGSYGVTATVLAGGNYSASPAAGVITIGAANATVLLSDLSHVWDGSAKSASATTTPAGLALSITYDGSATAPSAAGSYAVVATITAAGYSGSASGTLIIAKANATVTLTDLQRTYDGTPKPVTVTTNPAGLSHDVLYDGGATVPSAVGSYSVQVTVTDANHSGSASGILYIGTGNAELLAVNGAASFSGIAGQPLSGALPSVKATDSGGNPVAGVVITFAAAANNGILSGAVQTTDGNGIATLGGWILDPTPGLNTLSASAAGVTGAVTFTATGTAAPSALSVSITDGRRFTKVGQALTYTIVVANSGTSNLTSVAVSDTLPAELDAAGATWQCIPVNGAVCAGGNGDLVDTINLPAGSSVVYLLSTTVVEGPNERISNTVTATGVSGTASATDITDTVLFRDGFEIGGDGAQAVGGELTDMGNLSQQTSIGLHLHAGALGSLEVVSLASSRDGAFRVEAIAIDGQVWLRLVARADTGEQASTWTRFDGEYAMLMLDGSNLLLIGSSTELMIALDRGGEFSLSQPLN